jgi:hypothetical protein
MNSAHPVECLLIAKHVEQHLRPDCTRTYCIHPNTTSPVFDRGSFGQAKHSVFAGNVGAGGWKCQQATD